MGRQDFTFFLQTAGECCVTVGSMKKHIRAHALILTICLFASASFLFAGQALIVPLSQLVHDSSLIVIVEVKKVTEVEVPTGDGQVSRIHVAHAEIQQTIKSDITPIEKNRQIAIVGSSIPWSKAVWMPIERKRYLAFLNREQGHYRYGLKYALREISDEETVKWYDYDKPGDTVKFVDLKVKDAVQRINQAVE